MLHLRAEFVRYSYGTWKSMSWDLHWMVAQGPPNNGKRWVSEFMFMPCSWRFAPIDRDTRLGSDFAARMNVSTPIRPNWSLTMEGGMFVTSPGARQGEVSKSKILNQTEELHTGLRLIRCIGSPLGRCSILDQLVTEDLIGPVWMQQV